MSSFLRGTCWGSSLENDNNYEAESEDTFGSSPRSPNMTGLTLAYPESPNCLILSNPKQAKSRSQLRFAATPAPSATSRIPRWPCAYTAARQVSIPTTRPSGRPLGAVIWSGVQTNLVPIGGLSVGVPSIRPRVPSLPNRARET